MITGENYITLAKKHIDVSGEEYFRCSVSRFYYGLLHLAIKKIVDFGLNGSNEIRQKLKGIDTGQGIHSTVILKINNSSVKGLMFTAKQLREWADYRLDHTVDVSNPIVITDERGEEIHKITSQKEIIEQLNKAETYLRDKFLK